MLNMRNKLSLRRASLAIKNQDLEEACRILNTAGLRECREGQELCYKLADALCARAKKHRECDNTAEALLDLNRALEFGGNRPEAVRLKNEILVRRKQSPAEDIFTSARTVPLREPKEAPQDNYLLWIDGLGTYLVIPSARVVLGRYDSSAVPDIPLSGKVPGVAAEIIRTGDQYVLSAHTKLTVQGKQIKEKALANGDRVQMDKGTGFRFSVPCPFSSTAVLSLNGPSMIPGRSENAVLMDQFMVIGKKGFAHIRTVEGPEQLALFLKNGKLWAKSGSPITVEGNPAEALECSLEPEKRITVGGLSFTVTRYAGR